MRSRHGDGRRIPGAAGNRRRALRERAGRARRNRVGGLRSLQAARARRSHPAQSGGLCGCARGQTRFSRRLFCGRRDPHRFKRSFRFAPRGPRHRQDHPREETADLAFGYDLGSQRSRCAITRRRSTPRPKSSNKLLDFLLERARYILRERRGFAYDEINAAFAAGADDLVDAVERIAALQRHPQHEKFRAARGELQAHPQHSRKVRGQGRQGAGSCPSRTY